MIAKLSVIGLKNFATSVRFLSRVSDELYFEAKPECLILRVLGSGKSCLCSITFRNFYFINYQVSGVSFEDNNFKIPSRPLLKSLRHIKKVASCVIKFDLKTNCFFVYLVKLKGVEVQHTITVLDHENIQEQNPTMNLSNKIAFQPLLFNSLLINLPKGISELSITVTKNKVEIRNHINYPEKDFQTVRLMYRIDKSSFLEHVVDNDTCLIILSHDFLSILKYADAMRGQLEIKFSTSGNPIVVSVERDPSIKIEMIMATMEKEALKSLRKPPSVTSCRDLMETFVESRLIRRKRENEKNLFNFSNTKKEERLNPKVDLFASTSFKKNVKEKKKTEDRRINAKRKSSKMMEDSNEITTSSDKFKKHKQSEVLTQREEDEVSQVIADLEFLDDEENYNIQLNEQSNTSDFNFLDGMEGMKINQRKIGTMINSSQEPESSDNIRFDASKANFPSEDFPEAISIAKGQILNQSEILGEKHFEKYSQKTFVKEIFGFVLNSKNLTNADSADEDTDASL